jgi:putative membrane protein
MSYLIILLKGGIIGIANIIPGVSGGTLALILGIYKRLIESLHNINAETIRVGLTWLMSPRKQWPLLQAEWQRIEGMFLCLIGAGALGAVVLASRFMETILVSYHDAAYGFFFGLILVSIVFPFQYLKRLSWKEWLSMVIAAVFLVGLDVSVSDQEKLDKAEASHQRELFKEAKAHSAETGEPLPEDFASMPEVDLDAAKLLLIFSAGAVAISAMVLPGISGSFMLLLMGVYFDVLTAINQRDLLVLAVFAAGMAVGLLTVVRLVNWLLEKFYNPTLAFMIGLMAGSLWSIWPFKSSEDVAGQAVYLRNCLPGPSHALLPTLVTAFIGCALVGVFLVIDRRIGDKKELV